MAVMVLIEKFLLAMFVEGHIVTIYAIFVLILVTVLEEKIF